MVKEYIDVSGQYGAPIGSFPLLKINKSPAVERGASKKWCKEKGGSARVGFYDVLVKWHQFLSFWGLAS